MNKAVTKQYNEGKRGTGNIENQEFDDFGEQGKMPHFPSPTACVLDAPGGPVNNQKENIKT